MPWPCQPRAPQLHQRAMQHPSQSDWKIVERGWDAHVLGEAPSRFTDPVEAVRKLRVTACRLNDVHACKC